MALLASRQYHLILQQQKSRTVCNLSVFKNNNIITSGLRSNKLHESNTCISNHKAQEVIVIILYDNCDLSNENVR